jgi:UDP-N-acetylmuramate--alanine ligase
MTKHYHFIGIGGTGLAPIARILLERGNRVSGSDRILSPQAHELMALGAVVSEGHDGRNVAGAEVVIRSSAIPDGNPEVQAALAAGIPVLHRKEFLKELTAGKDTIAVAGTHGKTTTTAMITWALVSLNQDPSYVIGSISKNLKNSAHAGQGSHFVIEADEYDHMFLGLTPRVAVITFVEHDHPDCYPTPASYEKAFVDFAGQVLPGGVLLACQDNDGACKVLGQAPLSINSFTYGLDPRAAYEAQEVKPNEQGGFSFKAVFHSGGPRVQHLGMVALQVPGEHNVRNALAAMAVVHQLNLSTTTAAEALGTFAGTSRRFDLRGEVNGIAIVDDYAHHPTEIRTTLAATRARYPERRIWAIWQPHTYSRTEALFDEFTQAFKDADQVIVTEVYAAREQSDGFSAQQLVKKMQHSSVHFSPDLEEAAGYLLNHLQSGDVVLVLSAGDADQISTRVLAALKD